MASVRTFISEVTTGLLESFLIHHGGKLPEGYLDARTPTDRAALLEANLSGSMSPGAWEKVLAVLDAIGELASPAGIVAMADLVDVAPPDLPSARARSLWLWLNHRPAFEQAEQILQTNRHRGGRRWTAFEVRPGIDFRRDGAAVENLATELKAIFECQNLAIEVFDRYGFGIGSDEALEDAGSVVQLIIYREGPPISEKAFDGDQIVTRSRKPVFDAAITYEPGSGRVECVADGRARRTDIVSAFAQNMLVMPTECAPREKRQYVITSLLEPRVFPTDPEDGIEAAIVDRLSLVPKDTNGVVVTLEIEPKVAPDIWAVANDQFGPEALARDFLLRDARLIIRFRLPGQTRLRSLPITFAPPSRSDLKERTLIERKIADKYLPRWSLIAV